MKATKTLASWRFSPTLGKTGIDKVRSRPVFRPSFRLAEASEATLPGSSVAEQVTVNHLVAGSIPARAAISSFCHEVTSDDRTRLNPSASETFTASMNFEQRSASDDVGQEFPKICASLCEFSKLDAGIADPV